MAAVPGVIFQDAELLRFPITAEQSDRAHKVALGIPNMAIFSIGARTATQKGNETYQYWCATCHGSGPGHPGTTALTAKYKGARPGLLEERTDLSPQGIRFAVRRGVSIMPFFKKTELTDPDLEAVVKYLTRTRASTPSVR
jgi:(+)-pinoresinol hydroxylase